MQIFTETGISSAVQYKYILVFDAILLICTVSTIFKKIYEYILFLVCLIVFSLFYRFVLSNWQCSWFHMLLNVKIGWISREHNSEIMNGCFGFKLYFENKFSDWDQAPQIDMVDLENSIFVIRPGCLHLSGSAPLLIPRHLSSRYPILPRRVSAQSDCHESISILLHHISPQFHVC